ncbi:HK97-gp10 family putative phage morphogenesis protein [Acinetobacter pittii]|uniref:HK97-gp10 family putative phage morphogenesis protein n=1 Tax=Acinetobacter pittii TaxID=48296 RepID=UPI00325FEE54
MADVDVKIEGLDEVLRKMNALTNKRQVRNAAMRAARKAMNVVRDAARQNAQAIDDPETAAKIFKNIKVSAGRMKDKSQVLMRVGVDGGASFSNPTPKPTSGGDTRHFRWVEFGSSHQPATPFLRPALSQNIENVTSRFVTSFNDEIDKELAKQ